MTTDTTTDFDLIDTPWGTVERWRARSLYTGGIQQLQNQYKNLLALNDDVQHIATSHATLEDARTALAQSVCDSAASIAIRFDSFVQRRLVRKQRADARRAVQDAQRRMDRIQQALDALGEPSEPEHHGELTTHAPTEPQHEEQLGASPDEEQITATGPTADQAPGDLPAELETGPAAQDPELLKSRDPTVQTPVAISLNEE
jgi:hypothetical protein